MQTFLKILRGSIARRLRARMPAVAPSAPINDTLDLSKIESGKLELDVEKASFAPLVGKHVLLAEDSMINQMFVKEVLTQIGCRVTLAENGRLALAAARANRDIDIVLMDGHMPEMDGFGAARALREAQKSGELAPMPIIALTSLTMKGDRERCLEAGMDDYLAKPVRKDELAAMLLKWIGSPEAGKKQAEDGASEMDGLDQRPRDELRLVLGKKYANFLRAYLQDTEARLQAIGQILASGGGMNKVALNAHSIFSSSAHFGATRLAELARAAEMKAVETTDAAALVPFYEAMRRSFAEARQTLLDDDQLTDLTMSMPMNTAPTVPTTEATT
jgi:CheY-like chemotaxis protein